MSALTDYADAAWRRKRADDELKAAKSALGVAEAALLGEWTEIGQQNASINGLRISIDHTLYAAPRRDEEARGQANDEERQALYAALEAYGAGELVKPNVNAMSLAAWVREILADIDYDDPNDALPEELRAVLKVSEKTRLTATKVS